MHTTPGTTTGVTFHHNGDFSGEVEICISDNADWLYKDGPAVEYEKPNEAFDLPGYHTVKVPFEDVKGLVAQYVRDKLIEKIETSDDESLLMGEW